MKILKSQLTQIIKEELEKIKEELTIDGKKLSPAKEKYIKALAEKEPKLARILRFAASAKRRKAAWSKKDTEVNPIVKAVAEPSKVEQAIGSAVEDTEKLVKLASNPDAEKAVAADAEKDKQAASKIAADAKKSGDKNKAKQAAISKEIAELSKIRRSKWAALVKAIEKGEETGKPINEWPPVTLAVFDKFSKEHTEAEERHFQLMSQMRELTGLKPMTKKDFQRLVGRADDAAKRR